MKDPRDIDWDDPLDRISEYFTVHEATWLPSWRVYHAATVIEQDNICHLASRMDTIRELVDAQIIVHCWIRPLVATIPESDRDGQNYNAFIGSTSTKSAHVTGDGVDWHAAGHAGFTECRLLRQRILPSLSGLGLRMEDVHGAWIHIDQKPVIFNRFFKP